MWKISKGSHHMLSLNQHISLSAKMNETKKDDTGSP